MGGDILDHPERIIPRIDNAFEEGHAVSTLPLQIQIRLVDTHAAGRNAPTHDMVASPPAAIP
jgi:hypothetical protein